MYRLLSFPGYVEEISTGTVVQVDSQNWQAEAYREWLAAGNIPEPCPPPYELHSPEHYRAIRAAAWAWMTEFVQERRYDTIESCCSYYDSTVTRYRLEARAMVAWRDAVNQALEALVKAPSAGVETWEQVRALLPQPGAYSWPTKEELPLDGVPPVTLPVD